MRQRQQAQAQQTQCQHRMGVVTARGQQIKDERVATDRQDVHDQQHLIEGSIAQPHHPCRPKTLGVHHGANALSAQFFNQAIEFVERAKLDAQLTHFLQLAQSFDALFDAHLDLGHQQVRQLFFHAAHIA